MEGVLDGFGTSDEVRTYLTAAFELHLSPRKLNNPFLPNPAARKPQSRFDKKLCRRWEATERVWGCETRKGVLMGEPVAKMCLTVLSLAADINARTLSGMNPSKALEYKFKDPEDPKKKKSAWDYKPSPFRLSSTHLTTRNLARTKGMFACAGDDHTAPGDVAQLENISLTLAMWGAVVSEEKYGISKRYIHYCSDYAFVFRPLPKQYDPITEGSVFKLDTLMIRLLSDCRKVSPGSFEEPDPFPGKIKSLTERMMWIGRHSEDRTAFNADGSLKRLAWTDLILLLFSQGLGRWCPSEYFKKPRSYIASHLGGCGLPTMERMEEDLPPWIRWMVTDTGKAASAVRTGTMTRRCRGVVLTDEDERQLLSEQLQVPRYSRSEIAEISRLADLHENPSQTAISSHIMKEFVSEDAINVRERKVETHIKFFKGKELNLDQKEFITYFTRQRNLVRLGQMGFESFCTRASSDEMEVLNDSLNVKKALVRFPTDEKVFVRRKDIDDLFPPSRVPDLTLEVAFLGGRQGLRTLASVPEMEVEDIDKYLEENSRVKTVMDQDVDNVVEESITLPDHYFHGVNSPYRNLNEVLASISRDRARRAARGGGPELTGATNSSRSETGSISTATSWCESLTRRFL
jgi:hypothetical protein